MYLSHCHIVICTDWVFGSQKEKWVGWQTTTNGLPPHFPSDVKKRGEELWHRTSTRTLHAGGHPIRNLVLTNSYGSGVGEGRGLEVSCCWRSWDVDKHNRPRQAARYLKMMIETKTLSTPQIYVEILTHIIKAAYVIEQKKSVDRIMSAIKDFTFFNSPHVAFIPRHN